MINVIPVKAYRIISKGEDLAKAVTASLAYNKETIKEKDVIIVSSKVTALCEDRARDLRRATPSREAESLGLEYNMSPQLAQLVIENSDLVIGGVEKVLLTMVNNTLIANAGIDKSNAGDEDTVILWPSKPYESASNLRNELRDYYKLHDLGVIISDSHVTPLRSGVIGSMIGVAGIRPVDDCIGRTDLFGRKMQYTKRAVADQLVSAAHLVMGECDEIVPFVLIRGANAGFTNEIINVNDSKVLFKDCLFMNSIRKYFQEGNNL
ncbi:MAG: coenzyme F420-0:L-glutamate ligase [Nanoarchaeota archaeon]|nr:coenzyme F420-0:L-glutamate ligase [Nanoarchaeota archaeon]